jgi:sec-independent protein translocase protein TatB
MFDVGWSEMLVIAIVLIVVVGPKDLPRMLRQFGRQTSKLRAMAGDFRRQFDEALKEAELDDVADTLNSVRRINPMNEIRKHLAPIEDVGQQVRAGLDEAMKPQSKPLAAETPVEPVAEEPLKTGAANLPGASTAAETAVTKAKKTPARSKAAKTGAAKAAAPAKPAKAAAPAKTPKAPAKTAAKPSAPTPAPKTAKGAATKASKAASASAKRAPAKAAPAGRKKTGSAR